MDDEKLFWMGLAVAALSDACRSLDDVGSINLDISGGSIGGRDETTVWSDGHGGRVEVFRDGRLFANGEFIGHCDRQGRVTNGQGDFAGTLKPDGSFFLPNGDLGYRLYR